MGWTGVINCAVFIFDSLGLFGSWARPYSGARCRGGAATVCRRGSGFVRRIAIRWLTTALACSTGLSRRSLEAMTGFFQ